MVPRLLKAIVARPRQGVAELVDARRAGVVVHALELALLLGGDEEGPRVLPGPVGRLLRVVHVAAVGARVRAGHGEGDGGHAARGALPLAQELEHDGLVGDLRGLRLPAGAGHEEVRRRGLRALRGAAQDPVGELDLHGARAARLAGAHVQPRRTPVVRGARLRRVLVAHAGGVRIPLRHPLDAAAVEGLHLLLQPAVDLRRSGGAGRPRGLRCARRPWGTLGGLLPGAARRRRPAAPLGLGRAGLLAPHPRRPGDAGGLLGVVGLAAAAAAWRPGGAGGLKRVVGPALLAASPLLAAGPRRLGPWSGLQVKRIVAAQFWRPGAGSGLRSVAIPDAGAPRRRGAHRRGCEVDVLLRARRRERRAAAAVVGLVDLDGRRQEAPPELAPARGRGRRLASGLRRLVWHISKLAPGLRR
mmetsp:Transcript_105628/g.298754  ORF Transcript_105628/g.298754 Transcript_105628/m.298754 type:complete len:415 (+) Transcript_105628:790-2034(+)